MGGGGGGGVSYAEIFLKIKKKVPQELVKGVDRIFRAGPKDDYLYTWRARPTGERKNEEAR